MKKTSKPYLYLLQPILLILSLINGPAVSKTPHDGVKEALNNYIQGSGYNHLDLLKKAFYDKGTLYLERRDKSLWVTAPEDYISLFEKNNKGDFNNRVAEIMNIDIEGNIATAKVEVIFTETNFRVIDYFLLKNFDGSWKILTKTASGKTSNHTTERILFIVSNTHFHRKLDEPAGGSFGEIINAYKVFKEAGYTVDFLSPEGGAIPLSYIDTSKPLQKEYLYNTDFMYALKYSKSPKVIKPKNYLAVHFLDGKNETANPEIQKIVKSISDRQNHSSSALVAKEMIELLMKNKSE